VFQAHHADALSQLDAVDRGADRAARSLGLGIGDELIDHQRDAVVEEGALPELIDIRLQQVPRGPAQGGELAPRPLADQEGVRLARLDQVDHLIHQVERQRAAVGASGERLPHGGGLGQPIERLGIDRGVSVVEGIELLNTNGSCSDELNGVGSIVNSHRGS
jgi:hypothetical protein